MWHGFLSFKVSHSVAFNVLLALFATTASASNFEQKDQDRIERFVQTEWIVGSELGFQTSALSQFENRIREVGLWAAEHHLPMPSGFSLFVDADAGFIIGSRAGIELVFLIPEDGNVQMGVFVATDAQFGAEAILGAGVGISLIFNMDQLEELAGPIIGANTDIRMIEGVGASLTIDVESDELLQAIDSFKAFTLKSPEAAAQKIWSLIAQKRLLSIGAQYDWGVGAEVSVAAGWRTQVYSTELPSDPAQAKARIAQIKLRALKAFIKRKRLGRILNNADATAAVRSMRSTDRFVSPLQQR